MKFTHNEKEHLLVKNHKSLDVGKDNSDFSLSFKIYWGGKKNCGGFKAIFQKEHHTPSIYRHEGNAKLHLAYKNTDGR